MNAKERKILEDEGLIYPSVMTNADRIRAMTDRELAVFMAANQGVTPFDGNDQLFNNWLDWLKSYYEKR